jgi:hypothetical protein
MTEQTPEQPHPAVLELAKVRAGMAAGLTPAQSARLQGATDEELTAAATAFAAELGAANSTSSAPRSGGNQGSDVASTTGVAAGAAAYRAKHGLDDEGRRPERRPALPTSGRKPLPDHDVQHGEPMTAAPTTSTTSFDEYLSTIRDQAIALNGQAVSVNLIGGQTIAGALAYVLEAVTGWPTGMNQWPNALTVTVSTKVHKIRLDHVSSLGQG